MIETIFITDFSHRLLLGDHPFLSNFEFSKNAKPVEGIPGKSTIICSKDPLEYPITYSPNLRIAHLKINDVILNILYRGFDNFQAAKYLVDLKEHIERKVAELCVKTVTGNYFLLLELLYSPDISFEHHFSSLLPKNKVFIEIVHNINCVTDGERTSINNTTGEVFLSTNQIKSLNLLLEKSNTVDVRSSYKFQNNENKLKMCCDGPETASILSFRTKENETIYFRMKREQNRIALESGYRGIFRFVEVVIPLGIHTYKVETHVSNGKCEFDVTTGTLYWRFKDWDFHKETLKFNLLTLEKDHDDRPITVNFRVENPSKSAIKILKAENPSQPSQEFWVRNTIQSGYYELN